MSDLLVVVALVLQIQNGQPVGTATGFFYVKNDTIYFVTNRHVVIDETKGIKSDLLRVRLHTDPNDLTKNKDVDIPLYTNGMAKWHVHPNYSTKKIDIAIVEIDPNNLQPYYFKALSATVFLPKEFPLALGEDVMVIGFPRGLSDTTHNLPINRSAMISSAHTIDFQGNPQFLVDANLHPGMSGSPVMTRAKSIWATSDGALKAYKEPVPYFLGVFSATLGFKLPSGQQEQLGLGTVWHGYLIEEIIDSMSKKNP
jgi:S1-C subfamily serine protease